MGHTPILSKQGLALVAKMRAACSGLPEFTEAEDKFGHTSFRVRDKPFIMMGQDEDGSVSAAFKVLPATQRRLVREHGFAISPYIGHHGWTGTKLSKNTDWKHVEKLVREAYGRAAPKSVLAALKLT